MLIRSLAIVVLSVGVAMATVGGALVMVLGAKVRTETEYGAKDWLRLAATLVTANPARSGEPMPVRAASSCGMPYERMTMSPRGVKFWSVKFPVRTLSGSLLM